MELVIEIESASLKLESASLKLEVLSLKLDALSLELRTCDNYTNITEIRATITSSVLNYRQPH